MLLAILSRMHDFVLNILLVLIIPIIILVFITRNLMIDFKNKVVKLNDTDVVKE